MNSFAGHDGEDSPLVINVVVDEKRSFWKSGDWKVNPRAILAELIGTSLFIFTLSMAAVVTNKHDLGFWCFVLAVGTALVIFLEQIFEIL
jgi:hypothetical protein